MYMYTRVYTTIFGVIRNAHVGALDRFTCALILWEQCPGWNISYAQKTQWMSFFSDDLDVAESVIPFTI